MAAPPQSTHLTFIEHTSSTVFSYILLFPVCVSFSPCVTGLRRFSGGGGLTPTLLFQGLTLLQSGSEQQPSKRPNLT